MGDDHATQHADAWHRHRDRPRGRFRPEPARLGAIGRAGTGGRRLLLRGGGQGEPGHQEFPFQRRRADLRHRHAHRRQRLLRSGLCRRHRRRQPDRREGPAARLRVADRRPGARDRDPEPDRPGPDARRSDPDHAAGRRLQRHRQDRRGQRHPGRDDQLLRRHHLQPQRHQPHRPGRVRRRDRRRGAGRLPDGEGRRIRARSCCRPRPRWATSRSTTA